MARFFTKQVLVGSMAIVCAFVPSGLLAAGQDDSPRGSPEAVRATIAQRTYFVAAVQTLPTQEGWVIPAIGMDGPGAGVTLAYIQQQYAGNPEPGNVLPHRTLRPHIYTSWGLNAPLAEPTQGQVHILLNGGDVFDCGQRALYDESGHVRIMGAVHMTGRSVMLAPIAYQAALVAFYGENPAFELRFYGEGARYARLDDVFADLDIDVARGVAVEKGNRPQLQIAQLHEQGPTVIAAAKYYSAFEDGILMTDLYFCPQLVVLLLAMDMAIDSFLLPLEQLFAEAHAVVDQVQPAVFDGFLEVAMGNLIKLYPSLPHLARRHLEAAFAYLSEYRQLITSSIGIQTLSGALEELAKSEPTRRASIVQLMNDMRPQLEIRAASYFEWLWIYIQPLYAVLPTYCIPIGSRVGLGAHTYSSSEAWAHARAQGVFSIFPDRAFDPACDPIVGLGTSYGLWPDPHLMLTWLPNLDSLSSEGVANLESLLAAPPVEDCAPIAIMVPLCRDYFTGCFTYCEQDFARVRVNT
ncbi:MAG TPA: hypothetical protein PLV25_04425, partial [Opitutales bacterium]|nr:hypothetical protein [Opitutales bacterium]